MTNKDTKRKKKNPIHALGIKKKSIHAIPFWKIGTKTIKMVQTHAKNVRQ